MRQLSEHDTLLLNAETAQPQGANANVTLLHIYDQRSVPGGTLRFKTVLSRIESRLHRSPVFRSRLQRVPFALDHPYWIDDERFDLEYHVRHIGLPKPGDWRQFCIQAARIHARPLDLDRPLWEIYVIEGLDSLGDLPPGSFALLTKTHQVALQLTGGLDLTALLHDHADAPGAPGAPVNAPAAPWFPRKAPSPLSLAGRGLARAVVKPLRLAAPMTDAVTRQVAMLAPAAMDWAASLWGGATESTPAIRFNSVVSSRRVFDTRRFPLASFKAMRSLVPRATVNDVVLALCAGALRCYLAEHDELPASALSAVVPFLVRKGAAPASPASLTWVEVELPTDEADARRRLERIVAQTAASATVKQAVGARELADHRRHAAAATMALAGRMVGLAQLEQSRSAPLAHCTVTNVPGPLDAVSLCGARLAWFSSLLPLADGMGLGLAVTSCEGQVIVSATACRELMPDPAFFAQCVQASFDELMAVVPPTAKPRGKALRSRTPSSSARETRAARSG